MSNKNFDKSEFTQIMANLVLDVYSSAKDITYKNASDINFDPRVEWGMLFAYAEVLNSLKSIAEEYEVDLNYLFEDEGGFDPYKPLSFRPKNWPKNKSMV